MSNRADLLPCPFCGEWPEIVNYETENRKYVRSFDPDIVCRSKDCAVQDRYIPKQCWNTRADLQVKGEVK